MSDATLAAVVHRMNETADPKWMDPRQNREATPHGFRSTFKDWASEETGYPFEVVEMALAHAIEDETDAAYRRGDLLAKRRELMNAWAEYATGGRK
jgi:integrase